MVKSPAFAETEQSHQQLQDLALAARVRAALRMSPLTRDIRISISASAGRVTLAGEVSTDALLVIVEVVAAVPGVGDFDYRLLVPERSPTKPN